METIVTHVHLKPGVGSDWDAVMRARLAVARKRPGWIGGQLLRPADKDDRRVIIGTWKTRAAWEGWHHDPEFEESRAQLAGLEQAPAEHWWHAVVLDVRKGGAPPAKSLARSRGPKVRVKNRRHRSG
jgi:heme-degrading monooxygenase HmoA